MLNRNLLMTLDDCLYCTDCALHKTRRQVVVGDGPHDAQVVFIGEAPGADEDRLGRPFVGQAGQKLDAALQYAGYSREQVYITNLVKCRPPRNRKPVANEIMTCWHWLQAEVAIINPKVVVVMGAIAASCFGMKGAMKDIHGSTQHIDGRVYYFIYHPAATLYAPGLTTVVNNSLLMLNKLLNPRPAMQLTVFD